MTKIYGSLFVEEKEDGDAKTVSHRFFFIRPQTKVAYDNRHVR